MTNVLIYPQSVWNANSTPLGFPALSGELEVDVVVIGAGITGVTTALLLTQCGQKVALVEANEVGSSTTGHSTGNLYATVDSRLFSVKDKHGHDTLQDVVTSRLAALNFIEACVQDMKIDCDFQRVPLHLFATDKESAKAVSKEYQAALDAGLQVSKVPPDTFPFRAEAVTTLLDQAQFDPYRYVRGLATQLREKGCPVFENSPVLETSDDDYCTVKTDVGTITAKQIVKATHTPKGRYAVHTAMIPCREFAMAATLNGPLPAPGIYWHAGGGEDGHQYSIRPYRTNDGDFLVAVGEPHKVSHGTQEDLRKLTAYIHDHFDVADVKHTWAAQNYRPADNLPYIGISPLDKHTFIATGFAADGLVYGTLAAMIISDGICGRDNPCFDTYNPSRFTPAASAKNILSESLSVSRHMLQDHLFYGQVKALEDIKPGEGKTVKVDKEKVAVYRDFDDSLHIVSAICPHMGCVLHWNDPERSWDCPCHGSRFSVDGQVVEGPASKNLATPVIPDQAGARRRD
ncbi:MAG: FAD-dependent oxidoreductase [Pseudohongiellaceae bacterium]